MTSESLPVTEEWLHSIGFIDDRMGCPAYRDFHIRPHPICLGDIEHEYPAYACIRSLPIPVPQTRRDVLELMRLLGYSVTSK